MHKLFMNLKYKKQKFVPLKVILAVMCILLIFAEIAVIGIMVRRLEGQYKTVSVDELADVQPGDMIKGSISKSDTVLFFKAKLETGGMISCTLVRSRDNKLIAFVAADGSATQSFLRMEEIMDVPTLSMDFQGTVAGMLEQVRIPLNLNLVMHNTYHEYGLNENNLTSVYVKLSDPDTIDYVRYIFAGVGVGISLLAAVIALLWKSMNNIIYGLMVQKGYIKPELKVTKEDLLFDNVENYDSQGVNRIDSFYVDTEYNIRGEGETDLTLDRRRVDKVELGFDGQPLKPVRKIRPDDSIEFYSSGANEDGYFYVDENTVPTNNDDDDDNKRLRY